MELLYDLQTIRLSSPDWINTFFVLLSGSILILAPLIAAVTYWCADKKKGTYIICVFASAMLLNELLKVSFCIYRPWILDPRLVPAPQAVSTATNYSFPSSHSCAAAAILAALSFAAPENRKLHIFSLIFLLLLMFSRMYLGCHSLMDVCCGALVGTAAAFLLRPLLKDGFDEEHFTKLLVPVCCGLTVISVLYIYFKSYPLDYQADGSLLVDPAVMRADTIGICGMVAGLGFGLFLECTRIFFEMPPNRKAAFLRAVFGTILFALLYAVVLKKMFGFLDPSPNKFLRYFFCMLFVCAGYPLLCRRCHV